MAENILRVEGLTKVYPGFTLDKVSFCAPKGAIVGLIGENGAGKSTALEAILGLIRPDGGKVWLWGQEGESLEPAQREKIGVVLDGGNFPQGLTAEQLDRVLGRIYPSWQAKRYFALLNRLKVPGGKKVKELSKGMKVKLALAAALSHDSRFLVLDEVTSGLDPVVREDILDLFLEFVQDEEKGILISSHITGDLEKVADYIVFLHQGKVLLEKPKDQLLYEYGILRCGEEQFRALDRADLLAWRRQGYQWEALVADRKAAQRKYAQGVADPASLEEIMLMYVKGERP